MLSSSQPTSSRHQSGHASTLQSNDNTFAALRMHTYHCLHVDTARHIGTTSLHCTMQKHTSNKYVGICLMQHGHAPPRSRNCALPEAHLGWMVRLVSEIIGDVASWMSVWATVRTAARGDFVRRQPTGTLQAPKLLLALGPARHRRTSLHVAQAWPSSWPRAALPKMAYASCAHPSL